MAFTATAGDLAVYLNVTDLDTGRAEFLLTLAEDKCTAIVDPLPLTARGVVLDVAGRAYSNPTAVQSSAPGPFGTPLGALPGGLFLTKANIAELRRLAGELGSGAFTIDPTPDDAGPYGYWYPVPLSTEDYIPTYPYGFDVLP